MRSRVAAVALATGLVAAGVVLPVSAGALTNPSSRPTPSSTVRAPRSFSQTVYTPGEFFGGENPGAQCFTCSAADVTGIAPPSQSLDAGAGVDNLTGDFTTSQPLFRSPALGADLSVTLTYDAQLAQSELTAGSGGQPWGWGWNSGLSRSMTPAAGGSSGTATVTQGDGSQIAFSWSPSSGSSTSCPSGDYSATTMYTIQNAYITSGHQWCALANVKAQIADVASSATYFQTGGGAELDVFNWAGAFTNRTSAPGFNQSGYGLTYVYNVAPGTHPPGTSQNCPSTANHCSIIYSADGRSVVEAQTSGLLTTQMLDPLGTTYNFTYDAHGNLTSMTPYANTSSPGTWNYVYDTTQASPYSSDLVQVYDPDAGVGSSPPASPGAAHSTYVAYNYTTTPGMVTSTEDGTGATTTYAYSMGCATGACFNPSQTQTTTVTFPAQVPCPSWCTAVSPVETDVYASGVESSTTLGTVSAGPNQETWQYAWTFGYGSANSTEVITYPHALIGTAATESITMDPAGSVISATDPLGDVATSAYSDANGNVPPELLWSYPGSSSNGPNNPPAGSTVYTYNSRGQPTTANDPLGNQTAYHYYTNGSALCFVTPPTVAYPPGNSCSGSPWSGPATYAPAGSTVYTYDHQGDVSNVGVDYADTSTGADPQTWTASYDALGNELWSIPPAGQSGTQGPTNPFATVSTFTDGNLIATRTPPGLGTTTYTYDAALNPVMVQTPYSGVYRMAVFDSDNRPCYQLTNNLQTGLTCTTGSQAGSTTTTYVPGSTLPVSVTDGNGHTTTYYYGDLAFPNSPTEVVDAANQAVQYSAYDDYGNVCESGSVSISLGTSTQCNVVTGDTTAVYNALGDKTSMTDPSGNTTTIAYANTAFPTLKTSETNALSAVTSYSYNADGELTKITNPNSTLVTTAYDADGHACIQADNGSTYSCGGGTGVTGVTTYAYNGASDRTSMTTYTPSTLSTTYSYSTGQLISTTDSNSKTTSYLYNYAGQVQCETYPVSASTTCGTLSSPATGSTTNTIITRGYDASGRLSTVTDWLGNTTTYAYTKPSAPLAVTKITYPSASGLVTTMTHDNDGSLASLTAGSSISDTWSYDSDERVSTVGVNGSSSASAVYNANNQVTGATNLATWTKNDTYSIAANGSITNDQTPVQFTTSYGYNAGGELCWAANVASSSSACASPPIGATQTTNDTYTTNGQRASATSTWPSTGANISAVGSIAQSLAYGNSTLSVNPQHVGDALVLGISVNSGDTVSGVSGGGATWRFLARETGSLLGNTELWLGTVTSTGSSTITVSYTTSIGSTYVDIAAQEFTDGTGASTTWSEDTSGVLNNSGTSTVTLPTLTASASGELYVSLAFTSGAVTAGSNPGFTYDALSSGLYAFNPNMSGTVTPTATMPSGYYGSVGVTLAASSSSTISAVGSLQQNAGGGVSTLSVNPQHVGDALVVSAFINGSQSITSISGGGATWQKMARGYPGAYGFVELWLGTVTATGNSTITVSYSSSVSGTTIALAAQEYTNGTGPSTTWAEDSGGAVVNSSTTVNFPTLTPSRSTGELYVGYSQMGGSPSAGTTSGFTYDAATWGLFIFNPSVTATSAPTASQSPSASYESVAALIRAGVPSTTTTNYAWNPYGELCNVSLAVSTSCGSTPPTGNSYTYNGDGLRMTATSSVTVGPTTSTSTTDSTWDYVSGGSTPLNINDAATSGSTTTNTSYLYGDLLFGGTAPLEQIVTTSSGTTVSYLVATPQGVQGVYSSTGAVQEMALYSPYGSQTISAGARVTPFGFQGSYTDPTGLIYLINRYYDPTTDQFLSVDPMASLTGQPYVFTNDNPLNATDPNGLIPVLAGVETNSQVASVGTAFTNHENTVFVADAAETAHSVIRGVDRLLKKYADLIPFIRMQNALHEFFPPYRAAIAAVTSALAAYGQQITTALKVSVDAYQYFQNRAATSAVADSFNVAAEEFTSAQTVLGVMQAAAKLSTAQTELEVLGVEAADITQTAILDVFGVE